METIKVNMSPNPLDVQTIHASQNDGEARQWEFELHNNGELIDTSDITEQLFFKSYKGGTEQLLPENGSTPTTSPFLGDIKYPQGLLTDQEFTYRESPTQGNGYAKIKSIKGNTLVWNQLVRNGNFADSSRWAVRGSATIDSVASNVLTFTASAQGGGVYSNVSMVQTHKYLYAFEYQSSEQIAFNISGQGSANYDASSSFKRISAITQWSATTGEWQFRILSNATSNFSAIKIKNVMLFDLTQMGIADKSDDEIRQWFSSYYPLPYYDYNAGTLLSFNGTGLKTGGKNLIDFSTLEIGKNWTESSAVDRTIIEFAVEENKEYTISFDYSSNILNAILVFRTGWNNLQISNIDIGSVKEYTFTTPSTCKVVCVQFNARVNGFVLSMTDFYGFWNCALADTFSTTTLPISTYFPTGMKSAGSVYDELTPSKAITRIGAVDLGSLTWVYDSAYTRFYTDGLGGSIKFVEHNEVANVLTNDYSAYSNDTAWQGNIDKSMWVSSRRLYMVNKSITDAAAFKTAMTGVYLYYELKTPTETSFSTASLVTENAEIPLSNEDGVLIGKCTEQLSENPGFIDAKIKLSDADGECYSNKLQLHVERSPQ